MSRMRFGHTGLRGTLFMMKKTCNSKCEYCDNDEQLNMFFYTVHDFSKKDYY